MVRYEIEEEGKMQLVENLYIPALLLKEKN
jgi:hypothetical protein